MINAQSLPSREAEAAVNRANTLLNEREVSGQTGFSLSWLRQARIKGNGPAFVKIGSRVFYRPDDIAAFIERHIVTSTSCAK